MHLPEEDRNISIARIVFAFSMDKIDNRTDGLPMMGSIAWPIGSFNFKKCGTFMRLTNFLNQELVAWTCFYVLSGIK